MALKGVYSVSFEVKSPALNFFQDFIVKTNFPEKANMKMDTVGTEKERTRYIMSRFKISKEWYETIKETLPDDKHWQNVDSFKKLEGTMTVIEKEDGGGAEAMWTVDYEKTRSDVDNPHYIFETCVTFFKVMDENLRKSK